ncbi:GNAT family N-acetyltransferase [Bdellovibrio sp. GT3]|uniref:GNAT family N-acetyltransferase n=1 Tax=Bdellovibrio sp. GT3 TaxID=3136282 RepID=UPI0030F16D2C
MIRLEPMTADQLNHYSKFSFEKFLNDTAKLSGQSIEDLRAKFGDPPNRPSENDLWYVIHSEDSPVGFIWIQIQPKKQEAFIYDFFIEAEFRSKGLGRKTLVSGIELMKQRPVDKMRLCVYHDNAIARKLYASLGFRETDFNPERRQYTLELPL